MLQIATRIFGLLASALVIAVILARASIAQDGVLSVAEFLKLPAGMDGSQVQVRGTIYDADDASADFVDWRTQAQTVLDIETMEPTLRNHVHSNCAGIVVAPECEFVLEGVVVHFPAGASGLPEAHNELYQAKAMRPLGGA